jgi:hypothetical protein
MSMTIRANASGAVPCSHVPGIDDFPTVSQIVLAPALIRLQKMI